MATGKTLLYAGRTVQNPRKVKNRPYYKEGIKGGDPRNPLGDRWLGINVKVNGRTSYAYAIHGNNNANSIGKYVSAGCIRMHNKDVRWLYDKVKMNTPSSSKNKARP